jgi:8-oxo-dGTP diphosphatase
MSSKAEREFLAKYQPSDYPRPAVTVDLVVVTLIDADLKVLLVQRREHPFKGAWALPGGFLCVGDARKDQGEDLDEAARRELKEETRLDSKHLYLEQLYTFGRAGRDPRMRVVTVAYYALVRPDLAPFVAGGGDAARATWHPLGDLPPVAFDHAEIIECAIERIRGKIDYSNLAFELVPPTFTIAELRAVHEALKGKNYDPGNFRRRFQRMLTDGVIARAPGKRHTASKPALVYRFNLR